jgi:hypothetical protein
VFWLGVGDWIGVKREEKRVCVGVEQQKRVFFS